MHFFKHFLQQRRSLRRLTFYFAAIALVCLAFADIVISTRSPGHELWLMAKGLVTPRIEDSHQWLDAVIYTLTFSLQGVILAAGLGFVLSIFYHLAWVRVLGACLRSVHEVFWALIFIQIFGISTLAGVLAILLPFGGTIAKVYGEQLEESDPSPARALLPGGGTSISHFFYTRLPLAFHAMRNYTAYRMECAIRSSVVLGFIGLPTLGFHLETALRTGDYSSASALLLTLLALVYSLRFWFKAKWLWILVPAAFIARPLSAQWSAANLGQFLWDCVPGPIRQDWPLEKTLRWLLWLGEQIASGVWNTALLAQIVLVLTGIFALLGSTLNSSHFVAGMARSTGDGFLLILRSLPEYLLNFIGLIVLGPSMLPAIIAMTLHNGAIIGHLLGGHSDEIEPAAIPSGPLCRFAYYYVPTLYQRFLAYCFYRWEIIIRETAMLGILGIPTLGFYIDSAFEFLRFDVALILIAVSAGMTLSADYISRKLRHQFLKPDLRPAHGSQIQMAPLTFRNP
ncbi:PhnE/PtxC family ABC transporter permease [Microbulbifer rhizosphaerae]|uniref:Phosphonate transport system permease protein n=1 Tax=Microbulbifer rhizosphaerae TaxID=1562603 RepID=A0A7W4WFL6_9GAMM|nr:ABC transporter permease [Microbulbifer rhizosphaerae]MBB3063316.1 phosphonate transport system permease protein [Microbulbifer rhizosphaerae]